MSTATPLSEKIADIATKAKRDALERVQRRINRRNLAVEMDAARPGYVDPSSQKISANNSGTTQGEFTF